MTKVPRILSLLLVALAGATIVGSLQRDVWTDLGPGAGFFPLVVGGLLLALSVALTVELVRAPGDGAGSATDDPARRTGGSGEPAMDGRPAPPVHGDGTGEPFADPDAGTRAAGTHGDGPRALDTRALDTRGDGTDTAGTQAAGTDAEVREERKRPRPPFGAVPGPILVVSALVVSLMFMNVLGFRISIGLLVFFILAVVERMRVLHALALALAISLGSFYLFSELLDVDLQISGWGV